MRYFGYAAAICLLLALSMSASAEEAAGIDVQVPAAWALTPAAKAIDAVSGEYSLAGGEVKISGTGRAQFLHVPARGHNGTRLLSLYDPGSGIVFRNNTMIVPLSGGSLIVATDDIVAGQDGYSGMVTGLELDTQEISALRDGYRFSASASIFLKELVPAGSYRLAFVPGEPLTAAVSVDLAGDNLTLAAMPVVIEVDGTPEAGRDAMSFAIVTIQADHNWTREHEEKNLTLCLYRNDLLTRPQHRTLKAEDGSALYQAIVPGSGALALVAAGAPGRGTGQTKVTDVLVLGSVLVVLVTALAIMVRRATKR
jgi:hypothetical protein